MKAKSVVGRKFPSLRLVSHFLLGLDHGPRRPLRVRSFLNAFTRRLRARVIDGAHDHVIRIHGDRRIVTMANDVGISKELLIFGEHEPLVTGLIKKAVARGMTCLDIGSNIGYYVILEEKLVGGEGLVVAFEPSTKAFEYLNRSIAINHLPRVRTYNLAVGDSDGTLHFESSRKSNLSRVVDGIPGADSETVYSKKIDTLVAKENLQRIHFIRMDVEGYEYKAILGAKETLKKSKPALMIEVHSGLLGKAATIELLELMQSLGYELNSLIPRGWDYTIVNQHKYVIRTSLAGVIEYVRSGQMPSKFKTFTLYLKHA